MHGLLHAALLWFWLFCFVPVGVFVRFFSDLSVEEIKLTHSFLTRAKLACPASPVRFSPL
jgi:hypothetical protein